MNTTSKLAATFFAVAVAAAGAAQAATGGQIDSKTGNTVQTQPAIANIDSNVRAPEGTVAALHPAPLQSAAVVTYSATRPDGTMTALHQPRRNVAETTAAVL